MAVALNILPGPILQLLLVDMYDFLIGLTMHLHQLIEVV